MCVCFFLGTALEEIAKVWRGGSVGGGEDQYGILEMLASDPYRALSLASAVLLQSHNSPESPS